MKYTWPDFSKCFGKESSRELKKEGVAVVNCIKDVFSSSDDLFSEEGGGFGPGFTKDFFESTHLNKGNGDMMSMQ